MQNINFIPVQDEGIYTFATVKKNVDLLRMFHRIIPQKSIEFLYEAKKMNQPASSFTIPIPIINKRQQIAYKVFKVKNDELCFEFSPQKLELDSWMLARDCTFDNSEKGEGKIWVGKPDEDKCNLNHVFHVFHCFRKYEDAVKYKRFVEFQRFETTKCNFIIMPVEIDVSTFSQYEIIYLPYLDYAIFGVNSTLMYVDSNNIMI